MRRLSMLPASVWALASLRVLDASDNLLTGVPEQAAGLQLQTLDLRGNPIDIAAVPAELRKLLGTRLLLSS